MHDGSGRRLRLERAGAASLTGLWLLVALQGGCTPARGGWNVHALESQVPALAQMKGARLGDLPPHFVPIGDQLHLFLCHWTTPGVIAVSLPADASERERALLRRALDAYAGAGLGLAFELQDTAPRGIEIAFANETGDGALPGGTGDTVADCELGVADATGRKQARLRHAAILLRRSNPDLLERPVALDDDELAGAILHELGHALGFSGHVARGSSVMSANTQTVREAGARLNRGEPVDDAPLRALYAVPTGVLVGRAPLAPDTAAMYARLAALCAVAALDGPLSRVGDSSARIFFRNARGAPLALSVPRWPAALARPREIVFEANGPAQILMQTGPPTPPGPD